MLRLQGCTAYEAYNTLPSQGSHMRERAHQDDVEHAGLQALVTVLGQQVPGGLVVLKQLVQSVQCGLDLRLRLELYKGVGRE
jgi:hypothetical protein